MPRNSADSSLDELASIAVLRERLPEFGPVIDEHFAFYDELLFHLVMGDLERFYVREAASDRELQRRFWMTIDWLEMNGDARVQNAIGVSLIESFAWGTDQERALLIAARPLMSAGVRAIADGFLEPSPPDNTARSER